VHASRLTLSTDPVTIEIADYTVSGIRPGRASLAVAWLALFDSLGCAMASTGVPECMAVVSPVVPDATVSPATRIPGTTHHTDPVSAAFGTGCLIRWLDFSDSWVALESGHPSDNIGAILAAAEFESNRRHARGLRAYSLDDILCAMVQAYEIQGVLGLTNSLGQRGFDHAAFVRVASAAVTTRLLGGDHSEICSAVSHAWCDGHPLRIYRQAPNTGSRKSWAGPDAAARGLQLALLALRGEPGCGTVLGDPEWGMEARMFDGRPVSLSRPLGSYVMHNVLFKAAYPGVVHAQTALEAAVRLHPEVAERLVDIERIDLWSNSTTIRIASKNGVLRNAADRDHCLQYIVAVGLLKGCITADDFSDTAACDSRIDTLRSKMLVHEDPHFTRGNLAADVRSSANGIQVRFRDGTATERVDIHYPIGHASRRAECLPHLEHKLRRNLAARLSSKRCHTIMAMFHDRMKHTRMNVGDFLDLFVD
jgi:2-methylcitrate dehydratase